MTTRNMSVDNTKFILIAFVVLGHILEINRDCNIISEKLYTFIYSFHMPAFILLSGYFFSDEKKSRFWRSIMNLACTFLFFQILLCGNPLTYKLLEFSGGDF
jgi:fucose 4-O-acetylase-like acetyltransferase